ncbi:MAG: glycosyltransferase [Mariprofundaceae bacterium]
MNANLPVVSIVIPAFNCARYLKEAIDSVLCQDYPLIELIVLDDGSTDETSDILKEDKRKFFRASHANIGQAATLNKGWDIAKGELLGYLSADDALLPNAVSASVSSLKHNDAAVLSYCDYYLMDDSSSVTGRYDAPDYDYVEMLTRTLCFPGPGVIFRRQAFLEAGHWDVRLNQVPDYDYWLRLGLVGSFIRISKPLAKFRVHSASQTCGFVDEEKSDEVIDVLSRFFSMDGLSPELMALRGKSMSSACLFSASLHFRSGRYSKALGRIRQALINQPGSLFSVLSLQRLAYGLFFKSRKKWSVH